VRYFLSENRSRLMKPIIFIIVTSIIYSLINHFFHIEKGYLQYDESSKSATGLIFKWVQEHYGYSNIIMGIFIAGWTKILFRKYGYNFYEILILLCFVMGIGMLIFAFFALLQGITKIDMMQIAGYIGIAYCSWAIGQFFDKKNLINYFKAFAAYILGMLVSLTFAMAVGTLIDSFKNV